MSNNKYNSNKKKDNKKSIIVLVIIALAILGIWLLKNNETKKEETKVATIEIDETTEIKEVKFEETKELNLKELGKEGKPIILNFGSVDCAPCQELKPILKKLNEEGAATFRYVDIKQYPQLATGYKVELIPAQFFFYENGLPYTPSQKVIDSGIQFDYFVTDSKILKYTRHVGPLSEDQLLFIIEDMETQ